MKIVTRVAFVLFLAVSASNFSFSQDKKEAKKELKEYKCTSACKDGKCKYACGEKGHTCTKECKKDEKMGKR
jgi:hypothetical protein